jgi:hypothetical protein
VKYLLQHADRTDDIYPLEPVQERLACPFVERLSI